LYWGGELVSALAHFEQGLSFYDPQNPPPLFAEDYRIDCIFHAAYILWHLGYPDQSLQRIRETLVSAEGLSHPYSLALALGVVAILHLLRREAQLAQEQAEAVIALSNEQGLPYWVMMGRMARGAALAEQGQMEEGITQMQQALTAWQVMGAELTRIRLLLLPVRAYTKTGQVEEALALPC
jgi:predicted ATPase